jgi:hypothetical protein
MSEVQIVSGTEQAFSMMNTPLKEVYYSEVEASNTHFKNSLRFHRARGKTIHLVKNGLSLDGKEKVDYGKNAVPTLAQALEISISYAYKLCSFYEMYEDIAKFQDLMEFFSDNDFSLSWSHFNLLVHVDDQTRENLIAEAVEKKMSVRKLQELMASNNITINPDESSFITEDTPKESESTGVVVIETQQDIEDQPEPSTQSVSHPPSGDSEISMDVPKTLKKLYQAACKFSDKMVELVGNACVGLADTSGESARKEVFEGLTLCQDTLDTIKRQCAEFIPQFKQSYDRLVSEKKEKNKDG